MEREVVNGCLTFNCRSLRSFRAIATTWLKAAIELMRSIVLDELNIKEFVFVDDRAAFEKRSL